MSKADDFKVRPMKGVDDAGNPIVKEKRDATTDDPSSSISGMGGYRPVTRAPVKSYGPKRGALECQNNLMARPEPSKLLATCQCLNSAFLMSRRFMKVRTVCGKPLK